MAGFQKLASFAGITFRCSHIWSPVLSVPMSYSSLASDFGVARVMNMVCRVGQADMPG